MSDDGLSGAFLRLGKCGVSGSLLIEPAGVSSRRTEKVGFENETVDRH
jgi:hypothetical protein